MPLNHLFWEWTGGYKFTKSKKKENHLWSIDDIKIFARKKKELENLIQTVKIYSQDRGMEFGAEKCASSIMTKSKNETTEGTEPPTQESIRTLGEKEDGKYF